MTITVSVEELREYGVACERWYNQRIKIITEHGTICFDPSKDRHSIKTDTEYLKRWDEDNPFPKIIPSI